MRERQLRLLGGLTGGALLLTDAFVELSARAHFVRLWDHVWRTLPADVQRRIAAHWLRADLVADWGPARVLLVRRLPEGEAAHVTDGGMLLRIRVDLLDRPPAWLEPLLGHEFGHLLQHATRRVGVSFAEEAFDEAEADAAAALWGLDVAVLYRC